MPLLAVKVHGLKRDELGRTHPAVERLVATLNRSEVPILEQLRIGPGSGQANDLAEVQIDRIGNTVLERTSREIQSFQDYATAPLRKRPAAVAVAF